MGEWSDRRSRQAGTRRVPPLLGYLHRLPLRDLLCSLAGQRPAYPDGGRRRETGRLAHGSGETHLGFVQERARAGAIPQLACFPFDHPTDHPTIRPSDGTQLSFSSYWSLSRCTTAGSARVVVSPRARPSAMSLSSRRMILPLRVLGRSAENRMSSGRARAPIFFATCPFNSSRRASLAVLPSFNVTNAASA